MKGIFITGTDTGCGKTVISGLLGRYLTEKDINVVTQKWVQSGTEGIGEDIATHLRLMKKRLSDFNRFKEYISPYTFKFASSPHLASAIEGKKIVKNRLKKSFNMLSKNFPIVIVEGAGGALVPMNRDNLIIDVAKELDLSVIIVVNNKLGAINHTILTVEAVKNRGMNLLGIVFNNRHISPNKAVLEDNPKIIKRLTNEKILGTLPYKRDEDKLYKAFLPIGKRIFSNHE